MKVALITSWNHACGVADYSRGLAEALQGRVQVNIFPLPVEPDPASLRDLARRVSRDNDLAHIQHEYIFFGGRDPWNYHYRALAGNLRIPHVVTLHTWLRPFHGGPLWKRGMKAVRDGCYRLSGWSHYLQAGQFRAARRVMVMSRAFAKALVAAGVPGERIRTLFQGVPRLETAGNPEIGRRRWQIQGPMVVVFGFLNPAKGHLLAIEAWRRMRNPPLLVIAGGAYSDRESAFAEQVRLAAERFPGRIVLTGFLPNQELADLLAAADLVLLPYLSSTSSYSLSVAFSHGRPVLASNLECFREIAAQRPCLALFPAGDPEGLAQGVASLLADPAWIEQLQAEARLWASEHSWERVGEETVRIYEEAL